LLKQLIVLWPVIGHRSSPDAGDVSSALCISANQY
jgi:hypothetical protein